MVITNVGATCLLLKETRSFYTYIYNRFFLAFDVEIKLEKSNELCFFSPEIIVSIYVDHDNCIIITDFCKLTSILISI